MKRSLNVYVAPTGGTWATGWRVFADVDNNQSYTAGTDTLVSEAAAFPAGVTVNETTTATGFVDGVRSLRDVQRFGIPEIEQRGVPIRNDGVGQRDQPASLYRAEPGGSCSHLHGVDLQSDAVSDR